MFASRIVRQMASGANKDPAKVKKENQRVVRFLYELFVSNKNSSIRNRLAVDR